MQANVFGAKNPGGFSAACQMCSNSQQLRPAYSQGCFPTKNTKFKKWVKQNKTNVSLIFTESVKSISVLSNSVTKGDVEA